MPLMRDLIFFTVQTLVDSDHNEASAVQLSTVFLSCCEGETVLKDHSVETEYHICFISVDEALHKCWFNNDVQCVYI